MNEGKKLTQLVECGFAEAYTVLNQVRTNGQLFRVDFIKRTDNTIRTMIARCGVKSGQKGTRAKYRFSDKGLLSVYDMNAGGYRTVPIANILFIKQGDTGYKFSKLNAMSRSLSGSWTVELKNNKRTFKASTSPLFSK